MINPLKKPCEAVLKFALEGYVEVKQVVGIWFRKVHFPGKNTAKNARPQAPPQTVLNPSFRGKLDNYWNRLDNQQSARFDELRDAIIKSGENEL